MNKKLIRLTEADLHRIVKESVNRILEDWGTPYPGKDIEMPRLSTCIYVDGECVKQFNDGDPEAEIFYKKAKRKYPNSKVDIISNQY